MKFAPIHAAITTAALIFAGVQFGATPASSDVKPLRPDTLDAHKAPRGLCPPHFRPGSIQRNIHTIGTIYECSQRFVLRCKNHKYSVRTPQLVKQGSYWVVKYRCDERALRRDR